MARERLFQMELLRRIVNGETAELLGSKLLPSDILLRTLGLRHYGEQMYKNYGHQWPQDLKDNATAFLKGINDFQAKGPLPLEFTLLGIKPRPFEFGEMCGLAGYMALTFAEGLLSDPAYSVLLESLPQEQVDEFFVRRNMVMGQKKSMSHINAPDIKQLVVQLDRALSEVQALTGLFYGSNSWVVAPARSKSGSAILANDPHIAYALPAVWFEAHIETPEWSMYGHYLPLVPFPGLGHNSNNAWAITMSEVDDLDLYVEELNPADPTQVKFMGKWVHTEKRRENIKVRWSNDYAFDVVNTPHGPLIDQTKYAVKNKNISLKWAHHLADNNVVQSFWELSNARNVAEFKQALTHAAAPGFNMSWVDKEGHIAWQIMGRIPLRPPGALGIGLLNGSSGEHEYLGHLKASENPAIVDPPSGLIVTANSMPEVEFKHGHIPGYWQHPDRYERIHHMLAQQKQWSTEEMQALQTDETVYRAQERLKDLMALLPSEVKENKSDEEIFVRLKNWDGSAGKESWGAAVYFVWTHVLLKNIALDEMGHDMYEALGKPNDLMYFLDRILKRPNSLWWDDRTSADTKETAQQIVARSWTEAKEILQKKCGDDVQDWQWGKVHRLTYEHPLAKLPILGLLFKFGPYPIGGGTSIVNNTAWPRDNLDFDVRVGASTRRLIDMAKPEVSYGSLPSGNSGHLKSEFFANEMSDHINNRHRSQYFAWPEVVKNTKYLLELTPQ
jgi:penicillin amidase